MKLSIVLLVALLLTGCATFNHAARDAFNEEVAINKIIETWGTKVAASKDFRCGLIGAATKPFTPQMPVTLANVISDIVTFGDPASQKFKDGQLAGNFIAMYGISMGQGVRWLFNQLVSLGAIPTNIVSLFFGG